MSEVLGVVKSHEGAILVDSVVGRGSTIQALFPVSKEQKKASEVTASTDIRAEDLIDTALKKKTILVVDDEDLVRSMLSERLNILGYHSIQAVDGEHGIELFKSHGKSIDLVLLDFMMPGMNGVEVFEELLNIDPTVKVILSTGYATEEVLAMFSGRNPDAVIHKPYKLQNLKNELDRILEQRT
jgi:CheY-like chemotaxis protein